jgi:hypothetical protein
MTNLVQVPWQPQCWLTPDTLALLEAASDDLGAQLYIDGANGAWRSYDEQKRLYDLMLSGAGNTASNPDTGQRNHMRGAAFDLLRTDLAAQAACRRVGLVRDAAEPWHWNNPNWAAMPIIPTTTNTAGTTDTPLEDTLSAAEVKQITDHITAETNRLAGYVRRESRPARLYKREDGTLWIAGPSIVPRQVRKNTDKEHDLDILRGDTLILGQGDVDNPQSISEAAWASLVREHEAFRDYLRL